MSNRSKAIAWKKCAKKYRDLYLYGRLVRRHAQEYFDEKRGRIHKETQTACRQNKTLKKVNKSLKCCGNCDTWDQRDSTCGHEKAPTPLQNHAVRQDHCGEWECNTAAPLKRMEEGR